ncbi:hypothetical protein CP10139811_0370 [Chlamydia ibidis]|uniref:Uncharacterized protein n=2 Tax=Chlamydia ibidis TaxID=1405396 RepID=S7KDW5_9CHLA|nr:hypothetical protein [Chlamydia ibidis]EPP34391.1 hypothetical protein CP10139811_0370 [Chlamydia ibidis]EQM62963.1 hypothetical protein H359_0385 [Chlamydia ibidis 10-1398/6]
MCIPTIKFRCVSGGNGDQEGNSNQPVQAQPRRVSASFALSETTLLSTIQTYGEALQQVLDSNRVQRTGRYCRDTCGPGCRRRCPGWLDWCFNCLCTYLLNPTPEEEHTKSLTSFLQEQIDFFGPLVVGLALKNTENHVHSGLLQGEALSEEAKENFVQSCQSAQDTLSSLLQSDIQHSLFQFVNNPDHLPKDQDPNITLAKGGYTEFQKHTPDTPPTCWIISHSLSENEDNSDEDIPVDAHISRRLNWKKLTQQLANLKVVNINNPETPLPLGYTANSVVGLLQHIVIFMTEKNELTFQCPGYGLSIRYNALLMLITLSLVSLGFAPVSTTEELPATMNELKHLESIITHAKKIRDRRAHHKGKIDSHAANIQPGAASSTTEVDSPKGTPCRYFPSPQEQQQLLQLAVKTSACSAKILG